MAFLIETWLREIQQKLLSAFNNRILFMGLQGSYARGEASDESDIDFVLILDEAKFSDLETYQSIIHSMPFSEMQIKSAYEKLIHWCSKKITN